jgi:hypothetical protein
LGLERGGRMEKKWGMERGEGWRKTKRKEMDVGEEEVGGWG